MMRLAITVLTSLLLFCSAAGAHPLSGGSSNVISDDLILSARSVDTCADPSLAKIVFEGFDGQRKAHVLNFHWAFVASDTAQSAAFWMLQGPLFLAWETQQPFTVPLFQLGEPTDGLDYIFMVGPDSATPPIVSGFVNVGIMGWVYDTPVCGSVPLMSAVFPAQTDHYYTTDADEHAHLLSNGWTDAGVVAFVLPLPSS